MFGFIVAIALGSDGCDSLIFYLFFPYWVNGSLTGNLDICSLDLRVQEIKACIAATTRSQSFSVPRCGLFLIKGYLRRRGRRRCSDFHFQEELESGLVLSLVMR